LVQKILVVDDEQSIITLVTYNLKKEGYNVISALDGEQAYQRIREERPDLIVLDIMLPEIDGLTLCRNLRKENNHTPILMLTARGEELDRVLGLEIGADDYLTKPFSPRELTARIKAILRRGEIKSNQQETIKIGKLVIELGAYSVQVEGTPVELTAKEFELLSFLAQNPGRVFSRDYLLERLWNYDFIGDTRAVDVHISNIREKIEENPSKPEYLLTVRGVGYKFRGTENV
jgi:two-component system alkaline phosphatase synthesis response regulator PhoP